MPDDGRPLGDGELHQQSTDLNGYISKVVSRGGGKEIIAYYMEIREDLYREDQVDKEKRNRMVDDAIRGGQPGGARVEHGYIPSSGIKHEHN